MIKTIGELKEALNDTVFTDSTPICVSVWKNGQAEPVHINLVIEEVGTNINSQESYNGFGVEIIAILPDKEE